MGTAACSTQIRFTPLGDGSGQLCCENAKGLTFFLRSELTPLRVRETPGTLLKELEKPQAAEPSANKNWFSRLGKPSV
jgi:hypothetical protein